MTSAFFVVNVTGAHEISLPTDNFVKNFRNNSIELVLFNVGVGEAIVLRRKRRVITIDGGKGTKAREKKVAQKIKRYIVAHKAKIKALLATHPHLDHLNALPVLLEDNNLSLLTSKVNFYDNGDFGRSKRLRKNLFHRVNTLRGKGRLNWVKIPNESKGQKKVRIFRNTRIWMTVV